MIPFLLVVLVLAVDPLGFEPAALKRALFLSVGPLLFLAAWRDGALRRLATGSLGGALTCLVLLHAWSFAGASMAIVSDRPLLVVLGGAGSFLLLALIALRSREDAAERPFRLGDVTLGLALIVSVYAILQRLGIDPIFHNPARSAVAFFGNTNRAAEFLAPAVPLALAFRSAKNGFAKILATIAIPLATGALLLTQSRAGAIAAAAGAALALFATRRASPRSLGIDLALLALGAAMPLFVVGGSGYSLKTVAQSEAAIVSPDYEPNRQRALLYSATLEMIAERPLFGHGAGCFRTEFPRFREPEEARMRTLGGALSSAEDPHDEFLRLGAENGIPAAALFALFLLLALLAARDAALWPGDHPLRAAAPGYAAALLSLGVVALFRSTLDHAPVAVLTVALGGALAACRERGRDSTSTGPLFLVLPLHLIVIAVVGFRLLGGELALGWGERKLHSATDGAALHALEKYELGRALDPTNLALLQREAVLEEARARIEPARADRAVLARERILALDPRHVTSNLRLAARALERGDIEGANRRLKAALSALGESGLDASVARLLEQREERAAALLLLDSAKRGAGSLADLRLGAEKARREGRAEYAVHLLEAFLLMRPADGDAAFELAEALTALGAKDAAETAYLRSHVCRAAAALQRNDAVAARRAVENARRYGKLFEVEALAALLAWSEGDTEKIAALAALSRQGRPTSWFLAAIEPLRQSEKLQGGIAKLGL